MLLSLYLKHIANGGILDLVLLNNYVKEGVGDKVIKTSELKPTDVAFNIINKQISGQFLVEADKKLQWAIKGQPLVKPTLFVNKETGEIDY